MVVVVVVVVVVTVIVVVIVVVVIVVYIAKALNFFVTSTPTHKQRLFFLFLISETRPMQVLEFKNGFS